MTHLSDYSFLQRAVTLCYIFIFFIYRVWAVNKFRCLSPRRIFSGELKSLVTLILLLGMPCQQYYDVTSIWIKYREGFIYNPLDGQVYTKPYNYWTPGDQKLVTPTDYSLCVGMSLQTGTLFLLQMFWNYLASSVAKASFMGSWEFRMYIAWVCGSFAMYPLLQWNFSRSIYPFEYREIVPQLAYGISMLIVACSNIVTMFRFRKLMATAAQNVHGKKVMQKLAYFHDLNKVLTVSIILFGAGFLVLCIDGLTQAQFLNTHKFTADLCICIINLSSAVLWVVCILVVHPSESFAAHHSENDYYSHSHVHSQSNAPPPRMPSQPVGIVVEESVDYIPYKKQPTSPTSPLEYIRLPEKNNREYDGMRTPDERSVTKTNYDEFSDYGAPSPRPLHREDGVDFYPVQLPSPPPAVRPKSPLRARQQEIPMQAMVFKNTDSDAEPYDEEFSRRQRARVVQYSRHGSVTSADTGDDRYGQPF